MPATKNATVRRDLVVKVRIPRAYVRDVLALYAACRRGASFPDVAGYIADAFVSSVVVPFRLSRLRLELTTPIFREAGDAKQRKDNYIHKRLPPEMTQKILHLRFVENVEITAIAKRMKRSRSTILRVCQMHERAQARTP